MEMDESLELLNKDIAQKRLPTTVILSVYLVIGVVGNSIVLFIYSCRINNEDKGNNRHYIPSLALFDLIAIVSHALSSIIQNNYFVTFPSSELCKSLWYVSWWSSVISGLTLLLISLQRYFLISLNHRKELSDTKLRILLLLAIIVAAICTFPTLWFVDIRTKHVEYMGQNITTAICSFRNDNESKGGDIYFVFMLIGTVLNMVATSIFYLMIGKVIYTKFRKSQKCSFLKFLQACVNDTDDAQSRSSLDRIERPNSQNQSRASLDSNVILNSQNQSRASLDCNVIPNSQNQSRASLDCNVIPNSQNQSRASLDCNVIPNSQNQSRASLDSNVRRDSLKQMEEESKDNTKENKYNMSNAHRSRTASFDSIDFTETFVSNSNEKIVRSMQEEKCKEKRLKRTASARRTRKGKKAKTRFTTMFMLILIIYVISYIPPFLVQFVTGNSLEMLKHTSTTELNVILFFESTVLINHITNPFVYGYFDLVFRKEIKKLLCMR